ncbi:hypothetical protein DL766_007161 [Monosporascus sp. MC13-8B]|uniref:F-box domain-containing protein n=1 Tax=Monosporascus cannonballus TaxID=155416 RepID=A0ABY0GZH7_9PEZI|nr:hypothetical protein DL762_007671 [Monosporascus cannonballus]RYP00328.1 hypothetical protein DL763_000939 [Monosporascus cannonballus]RYP25068.1 hypothetical protein DL766_007161 [Monosporascus sp. MC13-8B]
MLIIVHLDLTNYDRSEQEQLLKSFLSCEVLEIHSLKAEKLSDVAPSILGSSELRRLALGGLTLSTQDDRVGMTLSSAQPLIPRLSHLVIFKESAVFDLGNFKSLRYLSIDLPKDDLANIFLLSEFVQIMSSVAAIERLYINCSTHMVVLDRQITRAQPLYAALDRQLARIASLQNVVFTWDLSGFESDSEETEIMYWFHPNEVGNWVSILLNFGQTKLHSCHERGIIIEAAHLAGSWTGNVCRNLEMPE